MEPITTLEQLATFGKDMEAAHAHVRTRLANLQVRRDVYVSEHPIMGPLSHQYKPVPDDYNSLYDHLPATIHLSPQVAAALATTHYPLQRQQEKYEDKRAWRAIAMPAQFLLSALLPFPTPTTMAANKLGLPEGSGTVAGEVFSFGSFIKNERDHKTFLEAFFKDYDHVVHNIMSAYQLSEKPNGDYVLKRGSYDWVYDAVTDWDHLKVTNVGLAPNFDMGKINTLVEKSVKSKPAGPSVT